MTERPRGGLGERSRLWAVAAAVVAAGIIGGLGPVLLRAPTVVERISFVNRGPYDIRVEVTGEPEQGWMGVTTARRRTTSVALEVIDQGPIWVFRFSAQGIDAGRLRVTRDELRQAGWTVEIPEAVIDRLRDAGASVSL